MPNNYRFAAFSTAQIPNAHTHNIPLCSLSHVALEGQGLNELPLHSEQDIVFSVKELSTPAKTSRRQKRDAAGTSDNLDQVQYTWTLPHLGRRLQLLPVVRHVKGAEEPLGCWVHLVAGALAGFASRTATAPLEVLRLQAITGHQRQRNPLKAAKQIVNDHGWMALYRGNLLNVVRAVPQKALDFFSFEMYKGWLGADKHQGMGLTFVAAGMAGATSTVLLHPLEVLRSRLTVGMSTSGRHRSLVATTAHMVRQEGLGSLYKGLLPSVMAIIPEAAITYGMFDWLKRSYARHTGETEAGLLPSIGCGVLSSLTGQMLAFPMESVARRLQVQQATGIKQRTLPFVQDLVRKEGPLALYRGSGTAILRVIPMAAVSFSTYEITRLWLAHVGDKTNDDWHPVRASAGPEGWLEEASVVPELREL